MSDRIHALETMLARNPYDARAHFGLAAEYEKVGDWNRVIEHLVKYLAQADDQGNAWGRLANAYRATNDLRAASRAYRNGIEAARKHGHPSMAAEFEDALETLAE
ncbi:MAG: tetratricopeptide repeat protein [Longimicrobiales bacterium]